jgi:hypothetical protein
MRQTRVSSFIEALTNVMIGYCISLAANSLIFPLFGWHISLRQNLLIGVYYTAVSIARSYALRRWFNAWIHRRLTQ